jgi:hypothetical protein
LSPESEGISCPCNPEVLPDFGTLDIKSAPFASMSEIVHSNFLLVGHLLGMENEIEESHLLSLRITSQASELRKFFAQSKLEGLSKEAIKKIPSPMEPQCYQSYKLVQKTWPIV